ncbi:hypothetical protein O3P69_005577, partial [Scylla paramamosain]
MRRYSRGHGEKFACPGWEKTELLASEEKNFVTVHGEPLASQGHAGEREKCPTRCVCSDGSSERT